MHECILIIVSSITYILGESNSVNQQDALRLIVSWLKTILTGCEVDPNTNRMDYSDDINTTHGVMDGEQNKKMQRYMDVIILDTGRRSWLMRWT